MKIYLSASFTDRLKMRPIRDKIWSLGHNVLSTWLDETVKPDFLDQFEWKKKLAEKDRAEVLSADLLILDGNGISTGKAVELGLALGQFHSKLVWVVSDTQHIFHCLADKLFSNWEDCLKYLETEYQSYELKDGSL